MDSCIISVQNVLNPLCVKFKNSDISAPSGTIKINFPQAKTCSIVNQNNLKKYNNDMKSLASNEAAISDECL